MVCVSGIEQNGETFEQWVPAGWQITVPTSPNETMIAYGFKTLPLPIGLELLEFRGKRNEGNDSPAGFKSTAARFDRGWRQRRSALAG